MSIVTITANVILLHVKIMNGLTISQLKLNHLSGKTGMKSCANSLIKVPLHLVQNYEEMHLGFVLTWFKGSNLTLSN